MIHWKFIDTDVWFSSQTEGSVQLDRWKAAKLLKISPDTKIIYKHDVTNNRSGSVVGAVRNGDQSDLLVGSLPEPTPTPKAEKPFSCLQCLTFWTALVLHLLYWETGIIETIMAAGTSAWLANEVDKIPKI